MLRHLRRRARLTQRDLGAAVGYSESYITRLESDERRPDPATVSARFVDALALAHEPELAHRLTELAQQASGGFLLKPEPSQFLAQPATNLPAQLTRFIGREREMAEVKRLLSSTRLFTLTGSGGAGKTRLAIEIGASFLGPGGLPPHPAFPGGVWWVDLAPLADPQLVPETVATTLGRRPMSRPALVVLIEYLLDRRVLLILDNCEHLIGACAELAEALLRACPDLRILTTSREPLNIPGEVTWRVPSLAMDDARLLFAERARAAHPDFAMTAANAEWVARICRRLDDMPLAIELAAARVRTFSVEQLAARMDDVFRLLTIGSRTALPRHQTLRAAIDWSYGLLPEAERALLRGLSVFAGGWTLEAAEAIHGAGVLDLLEQLVSKSLVVVDQVGAGTRYRLLETIRQYASAAAQTSEADAREHETIRQRHLEYFADLAQAGRLNVAGGVWHWIWNETVAAELDNTRAALNWAAQCGDWQSGWRLMTGVLGIWTVLGHGDELTRWMETIVLAHPAVSDAVRANAQTQIGRLSYTKGDVAGSIARYRAASELAHQLGDEQLIIEVDQYLGFLTPDGDQAIRLLSRVIRLAHQTGRINRESLALSMLGTRMRIKGDWQGAFVALSESIRLARETGSPSAIAGALGSMGRLLLEQGDYTQARGMLEESIVLNRQLGLHGWLGYDLENLAEVGLRQGDEALIRRALDETIPYYHRIDDLERVARGLVAAAGLAQMQGRLAQAAGLMGAAAALWRVHHTQALFEREITSEYDRLLPAVRAELDPTDFEAAWEEGQRLTLNQAIQEALAV